MVTIQIAAAVIQYSTYIILLAITSVFYYRYGKYAKGRMRDSIFIANGVTAIIFLVITLWILPEFIGINLPWPDPATFVSILIAAIDYGNLLQGQKIEENTTTASNGNKKGKRTKRK
jgi:hypothetical protein